MASRSFHSGLPWPASSIDRGAGGGEKEGFPAPCSLLPAPRRVMLAAAAPGISIHQACTRFCGCDPFKDRRAEGNCCGAARGWTAAAGIGLEVAGVTPRRAGTGGAAGMEGAVAPAGGTCDGGCHAYMVGGAIGGGPGAGRFTRGGPGGGKVRTCVTATGVTVTAADPDTAPPPARVPGAKVGRAGSARCSVDPGGIDAAQTVGHRPRERGLDGQGLAELVVGRGGELLSGVLVQARRAGSHRDTGQRLGDGHRDAARGGESAGIGDRDLEIVISGLCEGGSRVLGAMGPVAAEADGGRRRADGDPGVGEIRFAAVIGPQDAQGGARAGHGIGRGRRRRGHRRCGIVYGHRAGAADRAARGGADRPYRYCPARCRRRRH